jgi:hypothetical protein
MPSTARLVGKRIRVVRPSWTTAGAVDEGVPGFIFGAGVDAQFGFVSGRLYPSVDHVCTERCLYDCDVCGHEVDHIMFHQPGCPAAPESIDAVITIPPARDPVAEIIEESESA